MDDQDHQNSDEPKQDFFDRMWEGWISGGATGCENAEKWRNDKTEMSWKDWLGVAGTFGLICLFALGISLLE